MASDVLSLCDRIEARIGQTVTMSREQAEALIAAARESVALRDRAKLSAGLSHEAKKLHDAMRERAVRAEADRDDAQKRLSIACECLSVCKEQRNGAEDRRDEMEAERDKLAALLAQVRQKLSVVIRCQLDGDCGCLGCRVDAALARIEEGRE